MTVFVRNFCVKRLSDAVLRENGWLCDLLRHWRPAGDAIGKELQAPEEESPHIRLAIRKGSLNFYRAGQSVAKVSFDRRKKPQAIIHNKFVYEDGTGQAYVRLTSDGFPDEPGSKRLIRYECAHLLQWISRSQRYTGHEKRFVDLIMALNRNVIDLEMGLPAYAKGENAPRMDLVGLEPAGDQWRIVFWEAKLVDDGRARSRGESEPKVIARQLKPYANWLRYENNRKIVAAEYQRACRLLVLLHTIGQSLRPDIEELGCGILEVAAPGAPPPLIDDEPRLLIDAYTRKDSSFTKNGHLKKLREVYGRHVQMVHNLYHMTLEACA
jgi:hypothetical protein